MVDTNWSVGFCRVYFYTDKHARSHADVRGARRPYVKVVCDVRRPFLLCRVQSEKSDKVRTDDFRCHRSIKVFVTGTVLFAIEVVSLVSLYTVDAQHFIGEWASLPDSLSVAIPIRRRLGYLHQVRRLHLLRRRSPDASP